MNKGVVIGVAIVIIIVGIIGVTSLNFEASNNSVVEDIAEESEEEGRDLSVELTESVGLKSP